ncbi:MAG TPA: hypothetical protein VN653_12745 [Anaerolineales bacterium]|nr:hypothetical protein [Anaerolineales bacterium]
MTQNQYDYIIIGAGDLTPNPSPKGEGYHCSKNKALFYQQGLKWLF